MVLVDLKHPQHPPPLSQMPPASLPGLSGGASSFLTPGHSGQLEWIVEVNSSLSTSCTLKYTNKLAYLKYSSSSFCLHTSFMSLHCIKRWLRYYPHNHFVHYALCESTAGRGTPLLLATHLSMAHSQQGSQPLQKGFFYDADKTRPGGAGCRWKLRLSPWGAEDHGTEQKGPKGLCLESDQISFLS